MGTIYVVNLKTFQVAVETSRHLQQALEWFNFLKNCIFPNIIFQKILNLAEKCDFFHF